MWNLSGYRLMPLYRHVLPFLAAGLVCTAPAMAGAPLLEVPPQVPEALGEGEKYTVEKRIAVQFALGTFTGNFEETTLDAVRKAVGVGEMQHQGDAGDSMYWLCYTAADAQVPQRLWVMSHGEMGGSDHGVTELIAALVPADTAPTLTCPALPAALRPLSVDQRLRLGMTRAELLQALGEPTKTEDEWLAYHHLGPMQQCLQEMGVVIVRMQGERVVLLNAVKITSG